MSHDQHTRRHFLQASASLGAGGALAPCFINSAPAAEEPVGAKASKAGALKLGIASYTFLKFSLDQTLAMTARVGLKYVCLKSFHLALNATPEQIAEAAEKVKAAGMELYGGGVISMRKPDEVSKAFAYAKAAGMKTIVGVPYPDVLPLVNERVQQDDIRVAIHNHGPGDKTYPTPESAYERIKTLDKRIGLCIDVGHTLRYGVDPVRAVRQYADRLLDLHIKDVTGATAAGKTVEIGRGVIDIPGLVRALLDVGFGGICSFEYEKDPQDPLAGLAESVGYVRGVLATL